MITTSEYIDEKISGAILGKDPFYVAVILRADLHRQNPVFLTRWDEYYKKEPSCKHITDEVLYNKLMIDKYVRVYLACQNQLDG